MKSRAHFRGHPIHPMLVAFPIAFLAATPAFDLLGRLLDWPGGWSTGASLSVAAIASGLVAAVPGVIDYLGAVPPDSSAKTRATQHMLVNAGALILFALAWAFRDARTLRPDGVAIALEALGVGLMIVLRSAHSGRPHLSSTTRRSSGADRNEDRRRPSGRRSDASRADRSRMGHGRPL